MWSVTAVAASAYLVLGLDVCPPVQENLNNPEVALLSSTVECSISILSERQIDNTSVTWIHGNTNNIQTTHTNAHSFT